MDIGIDKVIMRRARDRDIVTPAEYCTIFHEGMAAWRKRPEQEIDNPYFTLDPADAATHMRMAAWEMGWWNGAKRSDLSEEG
jgi:hypothetical protein